MAQVMRFHEFPLNYNWSAMANNYGTSQTSALTIDIGDAVNMDYSCDASSANTENEVSSSFINDFGYQGASYGNYDREIVKSNLAQNRPVILPGGRNSGWWIFGVYDDGHAWVCDGFSSSYYCSSGTSSLYLHMNWGWVNSSEGQALNGWYAYNNWNPGEYTFNYKTGMVYNIRP